MSLHPPINPTETIMTDNEAYETEIEAIKGKLSNIYICSVGNDFYLSFEDRRFCYKATDADFSKMAEFITDYIYDGLDETQSDKDLEKWLLDDDMPGVAVTKITPYDTYDLMRGIDGTTELHEAIKREMIEFLNG